MEGIPRRTRGGKHEGKERNHSNKKETITHVLDPRNTKRYTIQSQQGTIHRVTGSSTLGGLEEGILREEVLNPTWIFSEEVSVPRGGVDPDG